MVRAGRSAGDVAEALGCSPQSITNWLRRSDLDQGIRKDGLNTEVEHLRSRGHCELPPRELTRVSGILRLEEEFSAGWRAPIISC